jgi:carbon storage regulator
MLVLTRRPNESFFVGDEVNIKVLEVKGSQVKIGIDAPRDIQIVRDDVKTTVARPQSRDIA